MLICPKCGDPLSLVERAMQCPRRHSYDIAAGGYVNLLLSGKSGDNIGDSREMITARRSFLDAGYYAGLSQAVCRKVQELEAGRRAYHILDAGCGEGYYTRAVAESLPEARVLGVDISRHACLAAAKRDKKSLYVTASASELPVSDSWADLLLSLFAPTFGIEFRRVLAAGGKVVVVAPGKDHLIELKRAVYDTAYLNAEDKHGLDGFSLESSQRVTYAVNLEDSSHIRQLFAMTPYAFRTPERGRARLEALQTIKVTLDFLLLIFG